MKKLLMSVLIAFLICGSIFADDIKLPHIIVHGTAIKKVIPDTLNWSLSVKNIDGELQNVAKQHTAIIEKVLTFLKDNKIPSEEIQTTRMSFGENWTYKNRSRVKEGYFASTSISFKINDFKMYNSLWLGLSKFKNLSIRNVSYDHSKMIDLQNKTRQKALLVAKEKAERLAKTIGSQIGEPLLIEENPSNRRSFYLAERSMNTKSKDSIAPGKISIQMSIKVAFRLITHDK